MAKRPTTPAIPQDNDGRLEYILKRVTEEPGVLSAEIAKELGITSLACSHLGDRLIRTGAIEIFKLANGARSNYLPKDLSKVRAKLEKQREADVAAREANADEGKAEKFRKLKEAAAAKKAAAAPDTPARRGKAAPAAAPAEATETPVRKRRRAVA